MTSPFRLWLIVLLAVAAPAVRDQSPDEKSAHWAWKAPVRATPPPIQSAWIANPIDAFVLSKIHAAGLTPAPAADRETWLRRVTYDLIGLPPTPAEIDAFLADQADTAFERVLDRLLASPHYGERWGRHWLDLARFAESNGYEHDEVRPDAWRYRDYVIASFNADKPYDRFLKEQLAGDELDPDNPAALIATGFNLLGPDMTDAASQDQRRQNTLDDMTDTAGLVFLGMTIGCARCHNHKFEPISIHDYYRLQAFFAPAEFRRDLPIAEAAAKAAHESIQQKYLESTRPLREAIGRLESPYRAKLTEARLAKLSEIARAAHLTPEDKRTATQKGLVADTAKMVDVPAKELNASLSDADHAEHQRLSAELKKWDTAKPPPLPKAAGLAESGRKTKTFVLFRGELHNQGDEVSPGWPTILGGDDTPAPIRPTGPKSSGRRAALAEWLTSPDHPLTARVMVNRLWHHHFGRGIVETPSDFGLRGKRPTHPELLDWLAREFVESGWSVKHMHRRMLLSSTYRQASRASAETLAKDPSNELFSRMNRLRLEGEAVRDSLLAIGGRLDRRFGGPGVFPPLPPETKVSAKEWATSPDPADHVRRSVYIFARRNLRFPFLEPFDVPDSNQSCPKRERSTTAPQALALLNSSDVMTAAKGLADRVQRETGQVEMAYRLTLGRRPTDRERDVANEFLRTSPMSELCRALFNLNEFVYLD